MNQIMQSHIKALKMWLLKTPRLDHLSNKQVLQRADAKKEIMMNIRRRQLLFLGHATREQPLESLYFSGKVEGKGGRGRPGIKFVDELARSCRRGLSATEMLRLTGLRQEWRRMIEGYVTAVG